MDHGLDVTSILRFWNFWLIIFETAVSLFGVYRRHSSLSSGIFLPPEKAGRMSSLCDGGPEKGIIIAATGPHFPNARVTVCRMLYRECHGSHKNRRSSSAGVLLLHTTKVAGARLFCFAVADSRTAYETHFLRRPAPLADLKTPQANWLGPATNAHGTIQRRNAKNR